MQQQSLLSSSGIQNWGLVCLLSYSSIVGVDSKLWLFTSIAY